MKNKIHPIWIILKIILALFITYAGVQHFLEPDFFVKVIPPFLMDFAMPIVYISGVVEIAIGILMFTKKYQKIGALAFMGLMLFFLPLHIWDVFAENPFTGSQQNALIRLVMQFVLIALPWKLSQVFASN